jgi:hypothetical protein
MILERSTARKEAIVSIVLDQRSVRSSGSAVRAGPQVATTIRHQTIKRLCASDSRIAQRPTPSIEARHAAICVRAVATARAKLRTAASRKAGIDR